MSDVVWLGGSTCSGKTTLARILADRLGRQLYSCDDHFDRHVREARKATQPSLYRFERDAGWNARVRALRGTEKAALWLSFYRERFASVTADLAGLEPTPVIAEGVDLLPELVGRVRGTLAAFLVPTRAFFEKHVVSRPWITSPVGDESWTYYEAVILHIGREATARGFPLLAVDGTRSLESIADELVEHWERK